ncbi:heparinase II/III family protein [Paenibacillus sp. LHD-117]|uniref:alginate lyase family protein n=1 Tax=Paenibacillus sp. LHD-117 TaxID=3071412 RepID=UPI0027DF355A|nr:heparinase II/III family protein [Paenibacillus sp. LHD-117]MDQ6421414.1 heparinase II/III family protein [Paenibacillus sp. LHD-117]
MNLQSWLKEPMTTAELLANLRSRLEPMNEKAAYIAAHMPDHVRETIANAELAYQGMIMLPGTGGAREFVGNPPGWLERRHNDNEYLWQLNRMNYWQELLEAYSLTKDEKYGRKVIDELLNWIETVPIPDDLIDKPLGYFTECHPLRALELGIRAYKIWPLVIEHLGHSELFTEEVLERYLTSVYKQIKALRNVSLQLWPKADHNHYLMECLGILTTALYFPELKEAEEWKTFAIDAIEKCSMAQLTEDGGQIEGCPSYHNGCMFWFGLAVVLANRFHFQFSPQYMERFRNNLDYSIYSLRPTGKCVPVGDSYANPLAVMAGVYGYFALEDISWLGLATNLIDVTEVVREASKHVWRALDVRKFVEELYSLRDRQFELDKPTTFWNRTLDQAIIRSGWDSKSLSFLFTCKSPIQNAHAHIDLMSFDFTALGKDMICDPGFFCYRDDDDRKQFKSSNYHSTLLIDERDHFEYINSFTFGAQKPGGIYNVEDRGFYRLASACHTNYEPIVHHRHISLVDNRFVLIADRVEGLEDHSVQRYFHLDFVEVEESSGGVTALSEIANLAIATSHTGEVDFLPGRLSDTNDIARPSTRVRFQDTHSGCVHFLTVLVPYQGEQRPDVRIIEAEDGVFDFELGERYRVEVRDRDMRIGKRA